MTNPTCHCSDRSIASRSAHANPTTGATLMYGPNQQAPHEGQDMTPCLPEKLPSLTSFQTTLESTHVSLWHPEGHDSPFVAFAMDTSAPLQVQSSTSSPKGVSMRGRRPSAPEPSASSARIGSPNPSRLQSRSIRRRAFFVNTDKAHVRMGQRKVSRWKSTAVNQKFSVQPSCLTGVSHLATTCVASGAEDSHSDVGVEHTGARCFSNEKAEGQRYYFHSDSARHGRGHHQKQQQQQEKQNQRQQQQQPQSSLSLLHEEEQQEEQQDSLRGLEQELEMHVNRKSQSLFHLPSDALPDSAIHPMPKTFFEDTEHNTEIDNSTQFSPNDQKNKGPVQNDATKNDEKACGRCKVLTEQKSTGICRMYIENPISSQPRRLQGRRNLIASLNLHIDLPASPMPSLSTSLKTSSVSTNDFDASTLVPRESDIGSGKTYATASACGQLRKVCLCGTPSEQWSSFREALHSYMATKNSITEVDDDAQGPPIAMPSPLLAENMSPCALVTCIHTDLSTCRTRLSCTPLTRHCMHSAKFCSHNRQSCDEEDDGCSHGKNNQSIPISSVACPLVSAACSNFEATEILPGLFLGTYRDAQNIEALAATGISLVINITEECPLTEEMRQNPYRISFMQFPLRDHSDENITQYFLPLTWLIHKQLHLRNSALMKAMATNATEVESPLSLRKLSSSGSGGVLVHCRMGISRSATIVLAYMMIYGLDMNCEICPKAWHQFTEPQSGSALPATASTPNSTPRDKCPAADEFPTGNKTLSSPWCCCCCGCRTSRSYHRSREKESTSKPVVIMNYRKAFEMVKRRKKDINPNIGFVLALRQLDYGALTPV